MLLANKFFDLVIGVDFHATVPPPFNPVHPFIGLTFDVSAYIPFMGATTYINKVPYGNSGTQGMLGTKVHIPLAGSFAAAPMIANESTNFFGSQKTFVEGMRLSGAGYMVMTCNDVGAPLSMQPGSKGKKPKASLFAPTAVTIPIPTGSPVIVGGPYVPDIISALKSLAMGFGMGCVMKAFGKVAKKALTALNHGVLKKSKYTQSLSKKFCKMGFEPVNLITGAVVYEGVDFELQGIIPISWERTWYSDSKHEGMLGHGWHSAYDIHLEYAGDDNAMLFVTSDGRPVLFSILEVGSEDYNRSEKLTLRRNGENSFELFDHQSRLNYTLHKREQDKVYRLERIDDEYGHAVSVNFVRERLESITDTVGRKILFDCDKQKRVTRAFMMIEGQEHTLVSYGYNEEGDMTAITDALGQTTVIEHQNHLMTRKTDRNGQTFYWEYDKKNRCVHTWGDGGLMEGWIEYHDGYNLVTNSLNATTRYDFTPEGLVTCVTDPLGNTDQTRYNAFGEVQDEIDAQGGITGYDYDDRGKMTAVHYPDGGVQRTLYDENERISQTITPANAATVYLYREDGLLRNKLTAAGQNIAYEYNSDYLLSCVKLNGEQQLSLEYDTMYNVVRADYPDGIYATWGYDTMGRMTKSFESSGRRSEYIYDALGRVVRCVTPDDNVIKLTYDAYEDVVKAEDAHRTVEFEYTPLGSMTKRTENGKSVEFIYDKDEQLTALRNEAGNYYRFGRDAAGRIVREVGFDGITRKYNRNMVGLVESVELSGERTNRYSYDRCGRLSTATYHDQTFDHYVYNSDGLLIKATNDNSEVVITRDRAGRILTETQDGHTVTSLYDERGYRNNILSSLGADIKVAYTAGGMTNRMSTDGWEMSMKYDSRGLEIEREMSGMVKATYEYDSIGRIARHRVRNHRSETRSVRYCWGINDRLFNIVDDLKKEIINFDYDSQGFLTFANYNNVEKLFRMPDSVGNLYKNKELEGRKYGEAGQLLETDKVKFNYDADGNLIERIHPDGVRWEYAWAANGMLRSVVRPDGREVGFEYDALGRRTAKTFGGQITRFLWDGNNPLHEWSYSLTERPQKVADEFGLVSVVGTEPVSDVTTWIFEEGTFRPTAKIIGDEQFSIVTDYLGTPAQMYDKFGNKVWELSLDIYGKVRNFEGNKYAPTACSCPFRYQGQYEDEETGLYYNRFRYYSPEMGGYLSQDPIGLAGNNPTLYGYVFNTGLEVDVFGLDISYQDAVEMAKQFLKPDVPVKKITTPSGRQIIQIFEEDGHTVTKRVGFDINPNSSHVQKLGPHLNLQTQIDGKIITTGPLADPHLAIDKSTIKASDICQ